MSDIVLKIKKIISIRNPFRLFYRKIFDTKKADRDCEIACFLRSLSPRIQSGNLLWIIDSGKFSGKRVIGGSSESRRFRSLQVIYMQSKLEDNNNYDRLKREDSGC